MEGNRGSSQRCDLLQKIREFTRAIVQDLSIERSPIVLIDRFRVHCTNPHANWLVMGWIRFLEGGRKFDCINHPNTAYPIPVQVEEVQDIISVADYILVVEKESVFERLANDQFCNTNRCIVITGRGYPDIPTRRWKLSLLLYNVSHHIAIYVTYLFVFMYLFGISVNICICTNRFLRLLIEKLCLPTYCLVDCDPYGFDILTTYRFGSMQMAYDAKQLHCPEVYWLGVFPSDSEKCCLPQQCFLPLTAEDKKKAEAMLNRCYLQREVPR
ncbi:hypothetical protein ACB092_06G027500 [Castanea dentata]